MFMKLMKKIGWLLHRGELGVRTKQREKEKKFNLRTRLIRAPTSFEGLKGQRQDRYASWISRDDDHDDDVHDESGCSSVRQKGGFPCCSHRCLRRSHGFSQSVIFPSCLLCCIHIERLEFGEELQEKEGERVKQAEHSNVFLLMLLGVLNLISVR